ncbi:DNA-directed RNA polymerase II subunit RPB1,DNA-directed RNA polymerase I subunit RPA1 [Lepeophtheirus salmonis]|uniref:DNA-directed RNA polymerase subunit n=1 Tax=Lepeophtheirus salmonis TaxID=72036 RepID=A0A7R8HB64_LEPSM|nr:DNA-directed RNA polymerase II subunit RPB1,DNA-directed RNA polymerase I subunit RPA1 [Lepeophtheirus salmonis]CAF2976602.1 DNA-directed RNA polymerase II subunit RPB1,DNA-directed RNA polymerase I subunit RPA1 [Lepeophtheirus salmonis]
MRLEPCPFGMFSSEEIRNLSAMEITNPNSFNQLGHPVQGGLYDLRMGPYSDRYMSCSTCLLRFDFCPGHFGHIELPLPVVNPLFYKELLTLIRHSCISCHKLHFSVVKKTLFLVQQKLLDLGLIVESQQCSHLVPTPGTSLDEESMSRTGSEYNDEVIVQKLMDHLQNVLDSNKKPSVTHSTRNKCGECGGYTKKISLYQSRFIYEGEDEDASKNKTELNPEELQRHLRETWLKDSNILKFMYPMLKDCSDMEHPTDIFFLNVVAVPPPKSRPCQYTGRIMTIHPQGASLQILVETKLKKCCETIRGDTMPMKLNYVWKVLQNCVDHLLDREMNASQKNSSGWGFKQLIERKTGLFRMHMMGKRVNFAARTVITPDPYINIDEIGLPEVFAKKLSYCVPVTPWNVEELRELVINGPNVHPGALFIETESGQRKMIDGNDPIQREALAKTLLTPSSDPGEDKMKFVYRHLINGDRMLLNRQPTLHKPSIMSHRARVLKGEKVMRLHYAVCKSYNADFDGDEMNAHFPQNEVARSEAQNLVGVSEQYLVPKDGTPLQGLIQDHVIAGVKMSIRGRFFDQAEYQQLVYSALINVKGRESVTLFSKTKIKSSDWLNQNPRPWKTSRLGSHSVKKGCSMCESEVIFSNGELVCGVIDKNQYGDECATSGVSLNANLGSLNSELRRFHRESYKAPQKRMKVDKGYKERLGPMTNRINSACLPRGLIKKFPENNLQLMVQAGAKRFHC